MQTTFETIEQLKADITAKIRTNLAQAITGALMQEVLLSMTDTIDYIKANASALAEEIVNRGLADDALGLRIDGKQDTISDLATIRSGAAAGATAYQKPGTGIPETDLAQAIRTLLAKANTAVQPAVIEAIYALIPDAASALNQLADKGFVNSSISTNTATFRGTYNLVSDLGLTVAATESQIAAALASTIPVVTNNDYSFVQIPVADDKPDVIERVDRYKYNGTSWAFEFSLNNSGFTAAQWAAINSGITTDLVTAFGNKYDKPATGIPSTDLAQAVQDALTAAGTAVQPAALSSYQLIANLVVALSAQSTDAQYPSAKCVYDAILAERMSIEAVTTGPAAITPSIGKYTKLTQSVGTLAITLPAITDNGYIQSLVIGLETGAAANVTFASADGKTIEFFDGFAIGNNGHYEINCLFNGTKWIVAYGIHAA